MNDEEDDLGALLESLNPKTRDDLRCVLIRDQGDRNLDHIAAAPLPRRARRRLGRHHRRIDDVPEAIRSVVRLIGDIDPES
jgi:hypothetical protein